ncbi:MAG: hypothetical protein ACOX6U_08315 [Oscillospiraceae bacterium]
MHKIKSFYIAHAGKCLMAIAAFLFVVAVVSLFFPKKVIREAMVNKASADGANIGEMVDGRSLELSYRADVNDLLGVKLQFANYGRTNDAGLIHVSIFKADDAVPLATYQIETRHISDGLVVDFGIPRQTESMGETYRIQVVSEGSFAGNAVTLLNSSEDHENLTTTVNGKPQENNVVFGIEYVGTSYPYTWTILLAATLFLTLSGAAPAGKPMLWKRKAG